MRRRRAPGIALGGRDRSGHHYFWKLMTIVQTFYDSDPEREWQRLELPLCQVEFASTVRAIERHFPAGGGIIDIGSGPGRYSLELARRGYKVTLFELSRRSLSLAQQRFEKEGLSAESFIQGD